ncbi:hypothetical protein [Actinoplanes sp. L3-i22]|uniref:hypothetical protein n=1 Tax=Actinoplanes sp. L3-i22 TaxID=2836373 RepID=UPI001C84F531|nr:hypothetical protein [Actinoplanes sp. L3-i22]
MDPTLDRLHTGCASQGDVRSVPIERVRPAAAVLDVIADDVEFRHFVAERTVSGNCREAGQWGDRKLSRHEALPSSELITSGCPAVIDEQR